MILRIEGMANSANFQPQQSSQRVLATDTGGTESEGLKKTSNDEIAKHVELQTKEEQEETGVKQEKTEKEVINAIEKANKHFKTYDIRLEFSIHDTTKQIIVKVINTEDDSVIREIPSEKVLDMVANMWEVAGILVDEKR